MFVEPAGSCLVATPPFEPAGCMARRFRPGDRGGEQWPDLADGQRDEAGVGGRRGVRAGGRRGLGQAPGKQGRQAGCRQPP